ncbi:MAG: FMN-binding glutamate synthase family protein [Gammaproteobacteria bacterium]|nr:FMN-binding glutamate synthase family protein [Gammaproteobacteria bacterium]
MISLIDILVQLFILVLGIGVLIVGVLYVIDRTQTSHAIRRNYPVIGRFRYLFETLGEFFRQYFFAMDREELPFNRAERTWVYRAAKNTDNTTAFGSTRDLRPVGTIMFANTMFPTLAEENREITPLIVGPYTDFPFLHRYIFNASGMSFGAISTPALTALAEGTKRAGIWLNTGEGGLSAHHLNAGGSVVFQIGTAKYGVRDENGNLSEKLLEEIAAHEQVRMFEIKISQGAKPGKGGILPAIKVTEEIAAVRKIPVGQASISPNRHAEINSVPDLLDFVNRIRSITRKPTGFKTVIGSFEWLDELCVLIRERGEESAPDFITVDSADGGTGAAPMSLIDNVGIPVRESLPIVVDILTKHGLRDRVRVIASGKMITPTGVAWAVCAGADFVVSARGFMFALGCIQALQCNKNTCPTGITTHNRRLQRGLDPVDKAERVYQYAMGIRKELAIIAHSCGVNEPRELQREHCRIVQADGRSSPLVELYPYVEAA